MKTKKITVMAMCIALAMILSYVESQIPSEAAGISLLRVLLVSLLFGHVASLLYSAAGAALSLLGMILLRRIPQFSCVAVSVTGGVLHNIGQILMAWALMGSNVVYYLPVLLFSGTIAGVVIGVVAALLIRRIKI